MAWTRRRVWVTGILGGSALLAGIAMRKFDDGDATGKFAAQNPASIALNPWIRIHPDNTVTVGIHRAEMGQGVATAIAMIMAAELGANWAQIRYEFTPLDRDYFHFGFLARGRPLGDTEGRPLAAAGTALIRGAMRLIGLNMTISSASTVDAWDSLRPVAAQTRELLIRAAAKRWALAPSELIASDGAVTHRASGRRASFGELAREAGQLTPKSNVPLRDVASAPLLGTDPQRLDSAEKTDGSARFGIDVRQPGQLYAAVIRCPQFGGELQSLSAGAAADLRGFRGAVQLLPDTVAAVAESTHVAFKAASLLAIVWRPAEAPPLDDQSQLAAYADLAKTPNSITVLGERRGQYDIDQTYSLPWLAHACMEPMNATAHWTAKTPDQAERLEVWAPTQAPSMALQEAARFTGIASEQVQVHCTLLGGGFGRRADVDYVVAAALLAQRFPGTPVQAIWSRAEDMQHDAYRPGAVVRMQAQITSGSKPSVAAVAATVVAQSVVASYAARTPNPRGGDAEDDKSIVNGLRDSVYDLPELAVNMIARELAIPVGFWRSVTHSYSCFALESFVDELAAALGENALVLRRRWLRDKPRASALLDRAERWHQANKLAPAELPGWRTGRGFAMAENHESVVAHWVDVAVKANNSAVLEDVRVSRVWSAIDCGRVIRPSSVRAQVEGSVMDGLWAAIRSRVAIANSRVLQSNFHDYPLLRITDAPSIEVDIVESSARPGGVGEPAVPPVAPALCNAIAQACGIRVRRLPVLARPSVSVNSIGRRV